MFANTWRRESLRCNLHDSVSNPQVQVLLNECILWSSVTRKILTCVRFSQFSEGHCPGKQVFVAVVSQTRSTRRVVSRPSPPHTHTWHLCSHCSTKVSILSLPAPFQFHPTVTRPLAFRPTAVARLELHIHGG